MDLSNVMEQKSFVIVGDTLNKEKYAYKIKQAMLEQGYEVQCVGKELSSLNDVSGEIDVIDLCIRADRGLALLRECRKAFKMLVLQPGASSPELISYLEENHIPYLQDCLLVGLKLYRS